MTHSNSLSRYPLNFYLTFRVALVTALLKKRLKFLILFSLLLIQVDKHNLRAEVPTNTTQIIYPVIVVIAALVVSIVGACGFSVLCCFDGEGLFDVPKHIKRGCKVI